MTPFVWANFFGTTLSASVSSGASSIQVASAAGAPTISGQQWAIVVQSASTPSVREVMYVTAITGTTLTVSRAQEGTAAGTWAIGDEVLGTNTEGLMAWLQSGRLLGVRVLVSSTTYTPTVGTNSIIVEVQGGGGAGGGAAITDGSHWSVGSGGASGSWCLAHFTSGFSGSAITIGAGGAPVAGAQGSSGGTTSFGSISAPGGGGGQTNSTTTSITGWSGQGIPGAIATGGLINAQGAPGSNGIILGNGPASGIGGTSRYGGGGQNGSTGPGVQGGGPGAGGSGAGSPTSQATALEGGAGIAGIVIVWEFA